MDALKKAIRKMIKEELSNSPQINELTNREYMEGLTHIPSLEAIQQGVAQIAGDLYDDGFDLEDISDYLCDIVRQNLPTSMDEVTVVDKKTKPQDVKGKDPVTVKSAIDTAKKTNKPVSIAEKEEDEDDEDVKDKEPTKSDLKKANKDSVASVSNKLQKLVSKMKEKAKEYTKAEGDAKEKIKDELKQMTKEKKKLEGQLD